jgi:hypothetical protein
MICGCELYGFLFESEIEDDAVKNPARNTKNYRKRGFDPAKSLTKRGLKLGQVNVPVVNFANVGARSDQCGLGRAETERRTLPAAWSCKQRTSAG